MVRAPKIIPIILKLVVLFSINAAGQNHLGVFPIIEKGFLYEEKDLQEMAKQASRIKAQLQVQKFDRLFAFPQLEAEVIIMKGDSTAYRETLSYINRTVNIFTFKQKYKDYIANINYKLLYSDWSLSKKWGPRFFLAQTASRSPWKFDMENLPQMHSIEIVNQKFWPFVRLYQVKNYDNDSLWAFALFSGNAGINRQPPVKYANLKWNAIYLLNAGGDDIADGLPAKMKLRLDSVSGTIRPRAYVVEACKFYASRQNYLPFIKSHWELTKFGIPFNNNEGSRAQKRKSIYPEFRLLNLDVDSLLIGSFLHFHPEIGYSSSLPSQFQSWLRESGNPDAFEERLLEIINDCELDTYNRLRFSNLYYGLLFNMPRDVAIEKLNTWKANLQCYPPSLSEVIRSYALPQLKNDGTGL